MQQLFPIFLCFTKFLFNTAQLQWCHVHTLYSWSRKRRQHMVQGGRWRLTPHVVMTGSLKTLQHNWQQSFTDGCSAKTWGSYIQTSTIVWLMWTGYCVYLLMPEPVTYVVVCVCASRHTVSSSSSCREKVERRDMLDSEWRDRTEMAESDLRGVPMGGWWSKGSNGSSYIQIAR